VIDHLSTFTGCEIVSESVPHGQHNTRPTVTFPAVWIVLHDDKDKYA